MAVPVKALNEVTHDAIRVLAREIGSRTPSGF